MWKRGHQQPFVAGGGPKDCGRVEVAAIIVTVAAVVVVLMSSDNMPHHRPGRLRLALGGRPIVNFSDFHDPWVVNGAPPS